MNINKENKDDKCSIIPECKRVSRKYLTDKDYICSGVLQEQLKKDDLPFDVIVIHVLSEDNKDNRIAFRQTPDESEITSRLLFLASIDSFNHKFETNWIKELFNLIPKIKINLIKNLFKNKIKPNILINFCTLDNVNKDYFCKKNSCIQTSREILGEDFFCSGIFQNDDIILCQHCDYKNRTKKIANYMMTPNVAKQLGSLISLSLSDWLMLVSTHLLG
jgi:hypothetical protein